MLVQSGKPAKVPETEKGIRANRTTEPTHRALEPRETYNTLHSRLKQNQTAYRTMPNPALTAQDATLTLQPYMIDRRH